MLASSLVLVLGLVVGQGPGEIPGLPAVLAANPTTEYLVVADWHGPGGLPGRAWVTVDYLLWVMQGGRLPPLVTGAPPGASFDANNPGTLGRSDTTILYGGNDSSNNDGQSGVRLRAGLWFDPCQQCGLEAGVFWLSPGSDPFRAFSDGTNGFLSRPATDANAGDLGAQIITGTDPAGTVFSGGVAIDNYSQFGGADLLLRKPLCCSDGCDPCGPGFRVDWLAGLRYLTQRDKLGITEQIDVADPADPAATAQLVVHDQFQTRNDFFGVQLGLHGVCWRDAWFIEARSSLTLGATHQQVDIDGATTITDNGTATTFPAGFLALASNIGHRSRTVFGVVPEVEIKLGRQLTERLRASVGYNFLWWSQVMRAGDQIDLAVNPNLLPPPPPVFSDPFGPPRPAFSFQGSGFWVQGATATLELRY